MNRQQYIDYYVNLLIRQYHDRPRARATIAWALANKASIYELAIALREAFSIDTAIGKQLDIVGRYLGLARLFNNGEIYMDDDVYRFFLNWKVISNLSMDNMELFHEAVIAVFGGAVTLVNNMDMTLSYWLRYPLPDKIVDILKADKNLLPAPTGVAVNYIVDNRTDRVFGFLDFRKNTTIVVNNPTVVGFSRVDDLKDANFITTDEVIT
ncbi:hypothetical protein FACS1894152_4220 [Bacilli bacterium]|nr:hypothetical protein FACS1894152_4220 [Bacilli bacterium]